MDASLLHDLLLFALPSGFLASLSTWIVGRRKRRNDMLGELQKSINMLSEENRKVLEENVALRRENADLKANQEEMLQRIGRLTKEVERLRRAISKKTGIDYEDKAPAARRRRAGDDGLRSQTLCNGEPPEGGNGRRTTYARRHAGCPTTSPAEGDEPLPGGPVGTAKPDDGAGAGPPGDGERDGGEPP